MRCSIPISYIHYGTEMDLYTVPFKPIKIFLPLRFVNVTLNILFNYATFTS
jgi:hypothetical protein